MADTVNITLAASPVTVAVTEAAAPIAVNVTEAAAPITVAITEAAAPVAVAVTQPAASPVTVNVTEGPPGADGPPGAPGTGKLWVPITAAAYAALSTPEKEDAAKVYDITDFVW